MLITRADATRSSRGNKVGLLQQITKIKTTTCIDFGHFCMFTRNGLQQRKKNSVSERKKCKWNILINRISNHSIPFHLFLLNPVLIWFQFSAIKFSLAQMTHHKLIQTTTAKALFSGRSQKSQNPWPDSELPCASQYSFNVWNKTEKKKKKKPFWSTLMWPPHSGNGCHFLQSTLLTCFAICCLSVTCWLNG